MKKIINRIEKLFNMNNLDITSLKERYDLVIHIGAPKTGSSAIQEYLVNNRNILEKIGFYYPSHSLDKNKVSGGHSDLANSIISNDAEKTSTLITQYKQVSKDKNLVLLLSSESFYNSPKEISDLFGLDRIKIISFFRNPLESLVSNYNQGVKRAFFSIRLDEFSNNVFNQKSISIMSGDILKIWEKKFGHQNLVTLDYDINKFVNISIQEFFLRELGLSNTTIDKIKPKEIKMINRSYGLAELELKRKINIILDKNEFNFNTKLDLFFQDSSDKNRNRIDLLDYLDEGLYKKLSKKFNLQTRNKINKNISGIEVLKQEIILIEKLKKEEVELYNYLRKRIIEYTGTNFDLCVDIIKLTELFDINMSWKKTNQKWFSQNQLNVMVDGKYQEADFLRDIAIILKDKGDNRNATKLIDRAFKLRPNGPFIKKLKYEYELTRDKKIY